MNQNQPNNQKENKNNSNTYPKTEMGFFELTKHQIKVDINKYEKYIAEDDNTVFKSRLTDSQGNPIVFKKRLNSLDSVMLEEAAYNVLDNEELKLEKKIETAETSLKEIEEKIEVAQAINDQKSLKELYIQRKLILKNLESLKTGYKTQSTEVKLAHILNDIFDLPSKIIRTISKYIKYFLRNSTIFKNIKPLMRSFMVRETITKLNKINQSVDELVRMQVPFGEQDARYATLVNHLASAGALHSQILKEFEN